MTIFKPWTVYTIDSINFDKIEEFMSNAKINDCELIQVDFSEIHNWERFCKMMWTKFDYPKFHCETIDELFEWYGGSPNFNAFWDWFRDPDFYIKKACIFNFSSFSNDEIQYFISGLNWAYSTSNSPIDDKTAAEQGDSYVLVIE